tara:strand:+ start:104 stop:559 length:456 start_codon:yes stop_codon:yes gene_type:complete
MSIELQLKETLKSAMRAKNKPLLNLVRMLKTKMMERTTKGGFTGEVDDALWTEVIGAYEKSQKKALIQYQDLGDSAVDQVKELTWEIDQLQAWLPEKASLAQIQAWVAEAVESMGGKDGLHSGRVMGQVMKAHKDVADATMVRQCVEAALA